MKSLIITSALVLIISAGIAKGQENEIRDIVGFNISQSMTAFDNSSRTNIQASFESGKKAFKIGMFLHNGVQLSGGELQFKRFIKSNTNFHISDQMNKFHSRFYFFYNMVYNRHDPTLGNQDYLTMQYNTEETLGKESKVTTFEHYIGLGMQVKIAPRLHLDGSIGLGAYFGTPDYENGALEKMSVHSKNEGLGTSFRLGIGYDLPYNNKEKEVKQAKAF